jgi:hypothetical protein
MYPSTLFAWWRGSGASAAAGEAGDTESLVLPEDIMSSETFGQLVMETSARADEIDPVPYHSFDEDSSSSVEMDDIGTRVTSMRVERATYLVDRVVLRRYGLDDGDASAEQRCAPDVGCAALTARDPATGLPPTLDWRNWRLLTRADSAVMGVVVEALKGERVLLEAPEGVCTVDGGRDTVAALCGGPCPACEELARQPAMCDHCKRHGEAQSLFESENQDGTEWMVLPLWAWVVYRLRAPAKAVTV